jgi:ABC-2 type transport system permease protein
MIRALVRVELALTARRGDSLLLLVAIPLLLLVFFSQVDVLPVPTGEERIDFLAPGVLALAVVSTGMVQTAIGVAFERQYGVLERLGTTPLGRGRLAAAKLLTVFVVLAAQTVLILAVAVALGFEVTWQVGNALGAVALGTAAFGGLGMLMAGRLRGETTLAAANGLYLVLLLLGGMVFPLSELPSALEGVARALPAAPLASLLQDAAGVSSGDSYRPEDWWILAAWAVAAPAAAALTFRWKASASRS